MKLNHIFGNFSIFLLLSVFTLVGCYAPQPPSTPTINPDLLYTAAAQTIIVQVTQAAATLITSPLSTLTPVPPTLTLQPTKTPKPSATPSPIPTLLPSATPTVQVTSITVLVFKDDFEQAQGWVALVDKNFSIGYANGGYQITVKMVTVNSPVYSIREEVFSDVRLEVDEVSATGPMNSYFGLLCRVGDGSNYYRFVIGRDGNYDIGKRVDSKYSSLGSGLNTDIIHSSGINHIRADCAGSMLTLYVNNQKLLEVQDNTFTKGDVGIVVGTKTEPGADILFDNFAIWTP